MEKGCGEKIVDKLSVDLKSKFPDTDGFSPRNLWDMKRFYEFYTVAGQKLPQSVAVSENNILPQVVAVLPWGHNRLILSKIKEKQEALYYAEAAVKMGWTRNLLLNLSKQTLIATQKNYQNYIISRHHDEFSMRYQGGMDGEDFIILKFTAEIGRYYSNFKSENLKLTENKRQKNASS